MAAAVLAAAFLLLVLPLPARPIALPASPPQSPAARGSFHIHTNRSDGSGSPDDAAAAAARAGLNFIVLTDHGDGTRTAGPAAISIRRARHRCRRAEHASRALHRHRPSASAVSAARRSPRRRRRTSGGSADSASSRIPTQPSRACGGTTGMPDSTAWNGSTPTRNGATSGRCSWRGRSRVIRSGRPKRWRRCSIVRTRRSIDGTRSRTRRPVVALAGADAHARAGWMDDDVNGYRRGWFLRIPSYDASFRTFAMRVALDRPLTNDAAADAAQIIAALKRGAVYSAVDALAAPAALEFFATSGGRRIGSGRSLQRGRGTLVTFTARTNAPRRSHRPSKRRTHPDAESVAGAHVRSGRGGHLPGRGVPLERARRPADSVDRQQPHLRSADGWGTALPAVPISRRRSREASRAARGTSEKDDESSAQLRRRDYPDRTCGVHVSARRTATAPGGTRRWASASGTALTERTHLALPRPRVATHARLGSGAPSAVRRSMAALDLSRRRTARCHRPVCRHDAGRLERRVRSQRSPTRCCSSSIRPTRCPGRQEASRWRICAWNGDSVGLTPVRVRLQVGPTSYVRTVSSKYIAAQPKMMFGAQAASAGAIRPPAPIAPNTLIAVQ